MCPREKNFTSVQSKHEDLTCITIEHKISLTWLSKYKEHGHGWLMMVSMKASHAWVISMIGECDGCMSTGGVRLLHAWRIIVYLVLLFRLSSAGNINGGPRNHTFHIGFSIPWSHDWEVRSNAASSWYNIGRGVLSVQASQKIIVPFLLLLYNYIISLFTY